MFDDADLITMAQAAALVKNRNGKMGVHVATIWRWCLTGCRGVTLWSTLRGGNRFTSRAALDDFFAAMNGQPERPRPGVQDESDVAAKEAKLAAMGV